MSERKRTQRPSPTRRQTNPPAKRDKRFRQLLDMARNGDAEAAADLWREYGFRFGEDKP